MERDMSEVLDGAVCGIDGCTPASSDRFGSAGRSEGLVFKQHAVVEGLFAAYFNEGRDIGDPTAPADIDAAAGLDRARVLAMLASDEGQAEVRSELQRAVNLRVSGVPTVLVNGVPLFSGAIRADLMEAELRKAAGHVRS
jgi:predicted DsbA family dithiol-disulfide isomerase